MATTTDIEPSRYLVRGPGYVGDCLAYSRQEAVWKGFRDYRDSLSTYFNPAEWTASDFQNINVEEEWYLEEEEMLSKCPDRGDSVEPTRDGSDGRGWIALNAIGIEKGI